MFQQNYYERKQLQFLIFIQSSRVAAGHPEGFFKLLQIFILNLQIQLIISNKNKKYKLFILQLKMESKALNSFLLQKNLLIKFKWIKFEFTT